MDGTRRNLSYYKDLLKVKINKVSDFALSPVRVPSSRLLYSSFLSHTYAVWALPSAHLSFTPITTTNHTVVEGLPKLRLTKDKEEEISIESRCKLDLLEECSLSLFGRLLMDRNQNQRALKNTMR